MQFVVIFNVHFPRYSLLRVSSIYYQRPCIQTLELEQVAQGGCGCPIPGGIQDQAGCGSGQPGLVVGNPAHCRGLKLDDHCGPFQTRSFYESIYM